MHRGPAWPHDGRMTSTLPESRPAPHAPAVHVVDRLVEARLLDPAARDHAIGVVTHALAPNAPVRAGVAAVVEVVAYLGAALVLAAGSLFVTSIWSDLELGVQVALVAVAALVLGAGGTAVARTGTAVVAGSPVAETRRRLGSTLLTGAAGFAALLVGLLLDRAGATPSWDEGGVDWTLLAASIAGLVVVLGGYRLAPSALGQLGAGVALVTAVLVVTTSFDDASLPSTVGLALVASAWLLATERGLWREPTLGRVLGVAAALWAAQWQVVDGTDGLGYALTALVAVAGTAAYLRRGAWPYLAVAVVAVTVVVPETVTDWTGGGLGAIGAVLLTGVTLLLASGAAALVRSRRTA